MVGQGGHDERRQESCLLPCFVGDHQVAPAETMKSGMGMDGVATLLQGCPRLGPEQGPNQVLGPEQGPMNLGGKKDKNEVKNCMQGLENSIFATFVEDQNIVCKTKNRLQDKKVFVFKEPKIFLRQKRCL